MNLRVGGVLDDLKAEKLEKERPFSSRRECGDYFTHQGDGKEEWYKRTQRKADKVVVKCPFLNQDIHTSTHEIYRKVKR